MLKIEGDLCITFQRSEHKAESFKQHNVKVELAFQASKLNKEKMKHL